MLVYRLFRACRPKNEEYTTLRSEISGLKLAVNTWPITTQQALFSVNLRTTTLNPFQHYVRYIAGYLKQLYPCQLRKEMFFDLPLLLTFSTKITSLF